MERTKVLANLFGAVHSFDDGTGLFIVQPNRVGFGVIAAPLAGGDAATQQKLAMIMQAPWPPDTLMQFTLSASPDLAGVTRAYGDLRRDCKDPLLQEFTRDRLAFLTQGADQPVDASGMQLREVHLVISVQIPYSGIAPDESVLSRIDDLRTTFEQSLRSAGFSYSRLTPGRYLRFMGAILNQDADASWRRTVSPSYDDTKLVCQQVLDPGNDITVESDGLWLAGKHRVTVLTPKRMPRKVYFGMAMRYLTDWQRGNRGIPDNVVITLNVLFPDREKARSALEKKRLYAMHSAEGAMARFVPAIKALSENLQMLAASIEEGDALVRAYLSMAIITRGEGESPAEQRRTRERALAASTNAVGYWGDLGFTLMRDRNFVLPMFCQMLPFAASPDLVNHLERYSSMAGAHAVALAPVQGSWRGTGTPLMTLVARDGQIMPVSYRDTDTNQNFLVVGGSGGGKSFSMSDTIANTLAMGGRVNVIEIGNSYKNLCNILGGQHLTFGPDKDVCINPFSLVTEYSEESDMLAEIIQVMASPKAGFDDYEMAGLKKVMSASFAVKGRDLTIDDLAEQLLGSMDERLEAIGKQLFDYTTAGSHGRYFNGRNSLKIESNFTVLELEDLRGKPTLQRVVLMLLMYQIERSIYLGNREQANLLLIDEAWSLLASDETAAFIQGAFRKYRKYKASVGIITQGISDVWETAGGRAIVENCATTFLLRQKADAIEAVQRERRLPFGDWGYELLKSLTTVKGEYSEILVASERGLGIGRLIVSPFYRKLYSTTPDDLVAIKRLQAQGLSLPDAIRRLVSDPSNGSRAA